MGEMTYLIKHLFKKVRYSDILKDLKLLETLHRNSISDNCPVEKYILSIVYDSPIRCPVCNNLNSIYSLKLQKTCGDKKCLHKLTSENAKGRDYSIIHSPEIRKIATKTRKGRGYWHGDNTKKRIGETNKKTWTIDKRKSETDKNRENGVYTKMSIAMKRKILTGEFTPNSTNRLNHKRLRSEITGISKYRSRWELKFHETYPYLKYETLRIPYSLNGVDHVYITDFVDENTKTVIEIKPSSMLTSEKVKAKELGAIEWCGANGYKYKIITENEFKFD
jgi:hypothetical protein